MNPRRRRGAAAALACLAVAALCAGTAQRAAADGDPASDVLLSQRMFVPADVGGTTTQQAQLRSLLRAAQQAGSPIRVAVIPSAYDLGSVTVLWRKPQVYAHFLAVELSNVYKGALLVVMPNGFGLHLPSKQHADAGQRLARIETGSKPGELLTSADTAVRTIAAAAGTPLSATHGGSSVDTETLAGAIAAALLAIVLGTALLLRRRRGPASRRQSWRAAARAVNAVALPRQRVLVGGLIAGLALAVATAALGLELGRGSAAARRPTAQSASRTTLFRFAAHSHAAPVFRLRDQDGRPVSLAAFHGKPVIVTFIDPLCRNLCPLAAHVLNQMDRELPPSRRIPIVAVSVDVYADTRADLLQDYTRWKLVPQWHWAIGTPRELASVWHNYGVQVIVQTKHIAGTAVHFIAHYELAYLLDSAGYLRALYLWPYSAAQVQRELASISQN
ncbi:MAG TPA: SCO family protein [Solirubrobacteraceae bacterium]|jgi:cytochrome oxidase Cu insertion factor (SCO1/SenC/PrrC family)|nr:SCO family protein [Solirubrobacteraceae bacterium]